MANRWRMFSVLIYKINDIRLRLTIPIIMIIGIVVLLPYAFTDTYCCTVPYH